jgi:hypothetical protein
MAGKKRPPGRKPPPPAEPARSPVGRSPARAGQERDALGRLRSGLDEALLEQLCEVHREGRDFRNATALRCGVHPRMLSRWLERGARDEDAGLHTRLFLAFGAIEGDIRAEWIGEVANPEASREESQFEGSKTATSRRVTGLQWLLERRFKQFRLDWVQRPDEGEVGELLAAQQTGFSPEAALAVVRAMITSMPPELAAPFLTWARARLPAGASIDGDTDHDPGQT